MHSDMPLKKYGPLGRGRLDRVCVLDHKLPKKLQSLV